MTNNSLDIGQKFKEIDKKLNNQGMSLNTDDLKFLYIHDDDTGEYLDYKQLPFKNRLYNKDKWTFFKYSLWYNKVGRIAFIITLVVFVLLVIGLGLWLGGVFSTPSGGVTNSELHSKFAKMIGIEESNIVSVRKNDVGGYDIVALIDGKNTAFISNGSTIRKV